jgi:hypothetical protein
MTQKTSTMKRSLLFFTLIIAIGITFTANAQTKKSAIGSWKFEVPQAPYGYDKGIILITQQGDSLVGEIKTNSGESFKLNKIISKNDSINISTYIQGEPVNVNAKIDGERMYGQAYWSQGSMDLKAERQESATKE